MTWFASFTRKASRSLSTPYHGSAHCRSTTSVDFGATVMPNVGSAVPVDEKSRQLDAPSRTIDPKPLGHFVSANSDRSQEPISRLVPASKRLLFPAAVR